MNRRIVFGLDGHDGTGKTTLALALADRFGANYQRPFEGRMGAALLKAGDRQDFEEILGIGKEGILSAIERGRGHDITILDRSWMTVASLVGEANFAAFFRRWNYWIPTVLCWTDLEVTLERLSFREEPREAIEKHRYYLHVYRILAQHVGCPIIRTDLNPKEECLTILAAWFETLTTEQRLPHAEKY